MKVRDNNFYIFSMNCIRCCVKQAEFLMAVYNSCFDGTPLSYQDSSVFLLFLWGMEEVRAFVYK